MSQLPWISDEDLGSAIEELLNRAEKAEMKAAENIQRNVIDPFSSLVIASSFNIDTPEDLTLLQQRSSTLSGIYSAIGDFHQNILSSIEGWENHDAGYDIENTSKKLLAEIKNKHNTMNSSNKERVIEQLDTAVKQKKEKGWKGYLVVIVPKLVECYERPIHTQRPVFEIDGSSFYDMATESKHALHDLFRASIEIIITKFGKTLPEDVRQHCTGIMEKNIPRVPS